MESNKVKEFMATQSEKSLDAIPTEEIKQVESETKKMIVKEPLNVRLENSITSQVVRVLSPGTVVDAEAIGGEWLKINDGYIMKKYVEAYEE